jgi:sugar phosphate isomerase/epimerase
MDLPFRIGTSSYIIPDDILPNVRFLAGKVQDVELVLFEVDDGQNNLPQPSTVRELRQIGRDQDLTYTVHLPLDLRLGSDGSEQHASLLKARKVIDCTRELEPWAYVLHLDGREVKNTADSQELSRWNDQAGRALEIAAGWAGGKDRLAVENLEGYPIDFWEDVLSRNQAGRCVDIGHLWRDGHDPIPYLERAFERTRVLHIHGIAERDHQSLAHVPQSELDRVLKWLVAQPYRGVMTLEIFGEADFVTSMAAVEEALGRIGKDMAWENG